MVRSGLLPSKRVGGPEELSVSPISDLDGGPPETKVDDVVASVQDAVPANPSVGGRSKDGARVSANQWA